MKVLIIILFFILNLSATVPTNENVTKLYVATFNRAPDSSGLSYWVNESGLNLEAIAKSFFDQTETQILYPSSTSSLSFVASVYINLFNRSPDNKGLNYWINELDSTKIDRSIFIQAVINGALNTELSNDATILANKTDVGLYFATDGQSDFTQASIVIKDITDNKLSVSAAISYIDSIGINAETDIYTNVALVPHQKSSIPMLGILVSYNNIAITSSDSVWSSKLFGFNEHELNHYYKEVSNSKFEFIKAKESSGIVNDGIISITLNKKHPDLDINSPFYSIIIHQDLKDVLESLDSVIDFSNYDNNANGFITSDELALTFVIAGYEDSYEGIHVKNGTWGHQSCSISSLSPTIDGVSLLGCLSGGNYAVFGEKHDIHNAHDATIGIIVHEIAHSVFLVPDLYNTSSSKGGIGNFGVMGGGVWATVDFQEYPGNTPVHFTAWTKVYLGWVEPIEGSGSESLYETSSPNYNVIKISINDDEYYLLENRNNSGYDRGLYSLDGNFNGGMTIWHINKKKLVSANIHFNTVNSNTSDKGVDLVEADNAVIDIISQSPGNEKALFYFPNVSEFNGIITDISKRGSSMTLNIK